MHCARIEYFSVSFLLLFLSLVSSYSAYGAAVSFENNCSTEMSVRLYDENDIAVIAPKWQYLNMGNGLTRKVGVGLDGDKFYKAHVSGNCTATLRKLCYGKICGSGKANFGNWACSEGGRASVWIDSIRHDAGKLKMC